MNLTLFNIVSKGNFPIKDLVRKDIGVNFASKAARNDVRKTYKVYQLKTYQ